MEPMRGVIKKGIVGYVLMGKSDLLCGLKAEQVDFELYENKSVEISGTKVGEILLKKPLVEITSIEEIK